MRQQMNGAPNVRFTPESGHKWGWVLMFAYNQKRTLVVPQMKPECAHRDAGGGAVDRIRGGPFRPRSVAFRLENLRFGYMLTHCLNAPEIILTRC